MKTILELLKSHKRFSINVTWNVCSLVILGISGILLNLFIGYFRGAAALGVFNQLFAIYIILSQFAVGGIQYSILQKLSCSNDNKQKRSEILNVGICIIFLSSCFVSGIAFFSSSLIASFFESHSLARGVCIIAPALIFFSLNKGFLMALNGLNEMKKYAFFQSFRYSLLLLSVLLLLIAKMPSVQLVFCFLITEMILFILLSLVLYRYHFSFTIPYQKIETCKNHLSFGVKGFLSGFLGEMNTRVDVLMIGYFLTDTHVGIYSFAAMIAEGFAQLSFVVRQNVDPVIGLKLKEGAVKKIEEMIKKLRKVFWPAMFVTGLFAVLCYPLFLKITGLDESFQGSYNIFILLIMGVCVNAGYRPFLGILLQGGHPEYHTLMMLMVVGSNVIMNLCLIPRMGIVGAAVATCMVLILEGFYLSRFTRKLHGIRL